MSEANAVIFGMVNLIGSRIYFEVTGLPSERMLCPYFILRSAEIRVPQCSPSTGGIHLSSGIGQTKVLIIPEREIFAVFFLQKVCQHFVEYQ